MEKLPCLRSLASAFALVVAACGSTNGGNSSSGDAGQVGSGNGSDGGSAADGGTGAQVISPLGTPTGPATTATIGSTGGSLADPTTAFTLTVPSGALAASTAVAVTPLNSATTPWDSPSGGFGITGLGALTAPATVKLKYTAGNVQSPSPSTLGVAMQDASGAWWVFPNPTWDGAALTVTLDPAAFAAIPSAPSRSPQVRPFAGRLDATSLWVYERFYIKGKGDLFVNDNSTYAAGICDPKAVASGNDKFLQFEDGTCQNSETSSGQVDWSASAGTITHTCAAAGCVAPYVAPASVPAQNPITITAVYKVTATPIPAMKQVKIHGFGKFNVVATYSSSPFQVCAGAPSPNYSDTVQFTLQETPPTPFYAASNIVDSPAVFTTPTLPGLTITVPVSYEMFTTTTSVNAVLSDVSHSLVSVEINGLGRTATCLYFDDKGALITQEQSAAGSQSVPFTFNVDPAAFDANKEQFVLVPPQGPGWQFKITEVF